MNQKTADLEKKKKATDLGKDNIKGLLVKLAIPAITAQLINALYNIVDRIYIGHIAENGDLALTGLGLAFPIIMLIAAFASLMAQGGAPLAAIHMGKGENDKAEKMMGNSFTMLIAVGIILMVIFQIFKTPILYAVGASSNTITFAEDYLRIYLIGTIPVMISLGLNMYINTQGFSKEGMVTVLIGAILNIILDPIFIFTFDMGVKGAAWATITSQTVSALWVLKFLYGKKTNLRLKLKSMLPDFKIIMPSLALGVSPFVMYSTESLINVVLNTMLQKTGGDMAVGAMTIISSLMQFVFLPLQGLSQGAQPITSYNFGAKQYGRVKETFQLLFKSCLAMGIIMWCIVMFFTSFLAGFFTPNQELIAFTVPAMRIYFFMVPAMGVQTSCQQSFIATGQAKISLFLALLRKIILLMPLAILLGNLGGAKGVFVAEPVADFLAATTTFILFMKRREYIFGKKAQ